MKLSVKWLQEKSACSDGVKWFTDQKEDQAIPVLKALVADDKLDWANWLIVRVMTSPQYLAYAIYAAEQVLDIFEKKYPGDKRPRQAIEAAKAVLKHDTRAAREAAREAAGAAWEAAGDAMRTKILKYGIGLLAEKE